MEDIHEQPLPAVPAGPVRRLRAAARQDGWDPSQRGYLQGGPVGFGEAISEGFKNIVTFNGRASRSAFWWSSSAQSSSIR